MSDHRRPEPGDTPDHQFTLANERTFLAWIRTALALLAGGVLLEQFADRLQPREVVVGLAVALALLAASLCGLAFLRWRAHETAVRDGRPLRTTLVLPFTAVSMAAVAAVVAVLLGMEWLAA